jgi:rhodanese-related sulfurtransferase
LFGRGIRSITADELEDKLRESTRVLIDVREPFEFADGHIAGAVNVPLGQLTEQAGQYDPRAETYVICQHGRRGMDAAKLLRGAGFKHVYKVDISEWHGRLERVRADDLLGAKV